MSRGAEGKTEKKREREIAAKPLNLIGGPDDETTAGHFAGRMKFFQRKWRAEKEREGERKLLRERIYTSGAACGGSDGAENR